MKNKYWFRPKKYGYGVYPVSWEGWLATLVLLAILLTMAYLQGFFDNSATEKDSIIFVAEALVCALLFIYLFKSKTDGALKWRWGSFKQ